MDKCMTEHKIGNHHEAFWEWDLNTGIITLNTECQHMIGCSEELPTINFRFLKELIHPDDRHAFFEAIRNLSKKPHERSTIVFRIKLETGAVRWIKCRSDGIYGAHHGDASKITGQIIDITDNWQSENQLFKLNRALLAISKCNQALLHATNQTTLLNDICHTITEMGYYRMAWVGFAENDTGKSIMVMAWSGVEHGYLKEVNISWDDSERGQGPAGQSIRTGQPYTCRNIRTDPAFRLWRDDALKRGYASVLAMPLKSGTSVFGTLVIFSGTTDAFDIEEMTLLSSLADNLAYGITMLRNRKARETAEEALRQSEARYRSLFHNQHTVMLMIDPESGSIIDANPAAESFYGWSRAELCSMTINEINILPERMVHEKMQQASNRLSNFFAFRHRLADGTIRDVEVTSGPIAVDGKSLLYSIVNDVTESKRFQNMAAENNRQMHYIMASTNTGLWETSLTSDNTSWSDEIWSLCGLEPNSCEPTFENWLKTMIPEDRETMRVAAENAVANLTEFTGIWRVRNADESIRWLMTKGSPFIEPDGTIDRYVGLVFDVTERKQASEAKEQLETQLRQAQRLETIGTLAGGIAHDFNNILTPILGYSELGLLTVPEEEPVHEYFEEIAHAADRAKTLVAQILTFSKAKESNPVPISFQKVLDEAMKLLRPLIPSTITIDYQIDHTCRNVLADPSQLHQMILNLCTNSFQAMDGKIGTLRIDLNEVAAGDAPQGTLPGLDNGIWVRFSVSDTGCGMDESTMEHIFEPFFTTKGPKTGTGLGLSVVHGIVAGFKGKITVTSRPGKGSTFTIYLPVIDRKEPCEKENCTIPKGNNSILCIDDEEGNTRIIQEMLTKIGFRVESVNLPKQALELFRQNPDSYDLAISDQTMPEMTGTDLADLMHEIRPHLPFVLLTGNENSIGKTTLESHGISKLLKKPVKLTKLVSTINEVLATVKK
ncbi:MAG: PAS domain S-box protein [Chlorobiaceae bacterium]|nr:PAS domain S-box protein [Chlorobiaceae bacterium]